MVLFSKERCFIILVAIFAYCCVEIKEYPTISTKNISSYIGNLKNHHYWLTTKCPYFQRPVVSLNQSVEWKRGTIPKNLKIKGVDGLYRHGSRYPSVSLNKAMKNVLHLADLQNVNFEVKESIKLLKSFFPLELNYTLHSRGKKEMQTLASDLSTITSKQFLRQCLDSGNFKVYSSPKTRCIQSAESYVEGLLSGLELNNQTLRKDYQRKLNQIVIDQSLREFEECERYKNVQELMNDVTSERQKFHKSVHFKEVTKKLNNNHKLNLNAKQVVNLYKLCQFQQALHNYSSICDVFDEEQLQVLQYDSDMKHYYKTGYGNKINYELFCSLVENVLENFDSVVNNEKKETTVLRFGHAETTIPIVTFLGLFRDEMSMNSSNFNLMKINRKWQTAEIAPFSANVVFTLYEDGETGVYFVSTSVNGYLVQLPGTDCYFCNYKNVFKRFLVDKLNSLEGGRACKNICN